MREMYSYHTSRFSHYFSGVCIFLLQSSNLTLTGKKAFELLSIQNCSNNFSSEVCILLSGRNFRIQRTKFHCLCSNLVPSIQKIQVKLFMMYYSAFMHLDVQHQQKIKSSFTTIGKQFYTFLRGGGRGLDRLTLKVYTPLSVQITCSVELCIGVYSTMQSPCCVSELQRLITLEEFNEQWKYTSLVFPL